MVKANTPILQAQQAYKTARTKYDEARERKSMTEEEMIELEKKMMELADSTVDTMAEAALNGFTGDDDITIDTIPESEEKVVEPDERTNIAQDSPDKDDKQKDSRQKSKSGSRHSQDDKDEVEELRSEIEKMKEKEARSKLAQKYAKLFPEPLREAKTKAFLEIKESVPLLTARVDEATNILSGKIPTHYAQGGESELFSLGEIQDSTSSGRMDFGGKI